MLDSIKSSGHENQRNNNGTVTSTANTIAKTTVKGIAIAATSIVYDLACGLVGKYLGTPLALPPPAIDAKGTSTNAAKLIEFAYDVFKELTENLYITQSGCRSEWYWDLAKLKHRPEQIYDTLVPIGKLFKKLLPYDDARPSYNNTRYQIPIAESNLRHRFWEIRKELEDGILELPLKVLDGKNEEIAQLKNQLGLKLKEKEELEKQLPAVKKKEEEAQNALNTLKGTHQQTLSEMTKLKSENENLLDCINHLNKAKDIIACNKLNFEEKNPKLLTLDELMTLNTTLQVLLEKEIYERLLAVQRLKMVCNVPGNTSYDRVVTYLANLKPSSRGNLFGDKALDKKLTLPSIYNKLLSGTPDAYSRFRKFCLEKLRCAAVNDADIPSNWSEYNGMFSLNEVLISKCEG